MKKLISLLLVFAMVLPDFAVFAGATETEPAVVETAAVEETEPVETVAEETEAVETEPEEETVVTEPVETEETETEATSETIDETVEETAPVAPEEMVTETSSKKYGYVDADGHKFADLPLDVETKLRIKYACTKANSGVRILNSDGIINPDDQGSCSWPGENKYIYGQDSWYTLQPGTYYIYIGKTHYTFKGGNYWIQMEMTYDNHVHDYSYSTRKIAPSCAYEGYTLHTCICGKSEKSDFVSRLPHKEVIDAAVAATCTQTGLTQGSHCTVCKNVLVKQDVIPMIAHTPVGGICQRCGIPCGVCGDDLTWTLDLTTGTLAISGTGAMYDWEYSFDTPWEGYAYDQIKSVQIPKGTTSIGKFAFGDCEGLTSVSIPTTVTKIGDSAFRGCEGLNQITIPDSVTSIGYAAFSRCSSLTSFVIPDSVIEIGDSLFYGCSSLTDITFPAGITTIGYSMFRECGSLTEITIPASITGIGSYAFRDCSALTSILFDGSAPSFAENAFTHVTANAICYDDRTGWTSRVMKDYGGNITWNCLHNYKSVVTKPTCTKQGYTTYSCGCGHVSVSDYVEATGHTMSKFKCQTCGYTGGQCGENLYWELSSDGVLTLTGSGAMTSHDWTTYVNKIKSVVIPEGVTSICDSALYECVYLTEITIPGTVTAIGKKAFSKCKALTTITIPEGVTRIEADTFTACLELSTVNLPESLTYIGDYAFSQCNSLRLIVIPANVRSIGSECFYALSDGIATIYFQGDAPSIGSYAFASGTQWVYAYYPSGNPTWTSSVMKKYGAINITWGANKICSNHRFWDWSIAENASCNKDGTKIRTCYNCGTRETESIPALGHDLTDWTIYKEPTTKEPGEERTTCSRCTYYESRVLDIIVIPGDFDGDDRATDSDALYLIWHTLHPNLFPLDKNVDFTGDGKVTDADAVALLWHSLYPKQYPLQ